MRAAFAAFTASTLLASTVLASSPALAGPEEDFVELREAIWQDQLDNSPILATRIGDRRGDGKLGEAGLEAYAKSVDEASAFLAQIDAIDADTLPLELSVDHAIIRSSLADTVDGAKHQQSWLINFTNRGGWFTGFASLPNRSPFFTVSDYESYISRLEGFVEVNNESVSTARRAVAAGYTQACEPMEGFEDRIAQYVVEDAESSSFWKPFAGDKPSAIGAEEWEALKMRAKAAITGSVIPAYRDFLDFYTEEYAPNCRSGTPGILATDGGADYYAYRVRSFTTTDMTPDEVHNLGLSEVARIRAEMVEVASEAGFETREEFVEHLRTDPQYYMTDADEYVAYAQALAKEIDGHMPKLRRFQATTTKSLCSKSSTSIHFAPMAPISPLLLRAGGSIQSGSALKWGFMIRPLNRWAG